MCHIQEWTKNQSSSCYKICFLVPSNVCSFLASQNEERHPLSANPRLGSQMGQVRSGLWEPLEGPWRKPSPPPCGPAQTLLSLTPCPLFLSSSFLPPFSPCTACLLKVPEASLRPTWFPGCSSRPASCAVCLPSHPCPPAWGKEQGLSGLQQYL